MAGLRLVDEGEHVEPISGEDVMREIGELLAKRLPLVPVDDPYRNTLGLLLATSGAKA